MLLPRYEKIRFMETFKRRRKPKLPRKPKIRSLTAGDQLRDMASKYPDFTAQRVGNEAIWEGNFNPSASCAIYRVRINALAGQRPWVQVLDPELRISSNQMMETHRFRHGGLCLHLREEWTPDQYIAETIVPWTALWLINYEYWLASGAWLGGGQHPK
jgi:hypothetical protein